MLPQSALLTYLKEASSLYYGKLEELRDAASAWLSYVPATFPHYTRHTIEHSDEIIAQLSLILFLDADPCQPKLKLSGTECYVLAAAAYLHDAGMVVPDDEKARVLGSDQWEDWISREPNKHRWEAIESIRQRSDIDPAIAHFTADLQTRYLIAEFVRPNHHSRSSAFLTANEPTLGRFSLDHPLLLRTIADVCASHGLQQYELDDAERYPSTRTVRGELVNVRLMATLLRIGDLLDMSSARACPLLLNAASRLPDDSLGHWTQYQRITQFSTTPDRIIIIAECSNANEHRLLRDWCRWLSDEVKGAQGLTGHMSRHADWIPPIATLEGSEPTIVIRPAPGATYIPHDWKFELDNELVFDRLVFDVYPDRYQFIRELTQNALDATRCQLYLDLPGFGQEAPESPTSIPEHIRMSYRVKVTVRNESVPNALSGNVEERQVLEIDDPGIGMDDEVIQKYLLQVARSFYTTPEFRRQFPFSPTSRFGVGFLSVFAVSDHVVIDTFKPTSSDPKARRLTLTGPRNYLLLEHSDRKVPGTKISLRLRDPLSAGFLTKVMTTMCRRVEFSVLVDDFGVETEVRAERSDDFTYEVISPTNADANLAVRCFPFESRGVSGEIYLFLEITKAGEDWAAWPRVRAEIESRPMTELPNLPQGLVCHNGLAGPLSIEPFGNKVERYDVRRYIPRVSLDRIFEDYTLHESNPSAETWRDILSGHLSTAPLAVGPNSWRYRQRLIGTFEKDLDWDDVPGTIPFYVSGESQLWSLADARALAVFSTELVRSSAGRHAATPPTLLATDLQYLSQGQRRALFWDRRPCRIFRIEGVTYIDWALGASHFAQRGPLATLDLEDETTISLALHITTDAPYSCVVLNSTHPFVMWLESFKAACLAAAGGLREDDFQRLCSVLFDPVSYGGLKLDRLLRFLEKLDSTTDLPQNLRPPRLTDDTRLFRWSSKP